MNLKKSLIIGFILVLFVLGGFLFQKMTDDTYDGMSIIPEKHKDIPLYKGLEPTEHTYVIDGNHWTDIYLFYKKELPELGWTAEYENSALNDGDEDNDWGGFHSRWRKEGFDGELSVSAHYNQYEEQTEVIFDKNPIYNSTIWIHHVPESICFYQDATDENCSVIKDEVKIEKIAGYINDAIDWNEELSPREETSVIDFGNMNIKVQYGNEKEIYFQSERGTKLMKPEMEFFELLNLPQ